MQYLNVSPMISALRVSPDHFEFTSGSLHHIPSRHRFQFDRGGRVYIDAQCDCSLLAVTSAQETELCEAFRDWRMAYWSPLQINREFAAHFAPHKGLRGMLIALTAWMHRALLRQSQGKSHLRDFTVPAE